MAGVAENNRQRVAIAILLVGLMLVLIGVGLMVSQERTIQATETPVTPQAQVDRISRAQLIQRVLFLLLVLVGIFSVASLAFLRWSRGFRRWLLHKPLPPTPADDVWAMHQLPDEGGNPPGNAGKWEGPSSG